jgi:LysR family hydrogen peroxide-inducible transcriptional activator
MKLLPSLKQLEYLVALAEEGHFGKAARRCNITASTLSAGIRDLEGVLEVSLAERSKRHVLMTAIGKDLATRASALLRDAEDLMALAASNREPMVGELKFGVIPTISPFLLPLVLPALHAQYPRLRLILREEQTAPLLDRLRAGEIDIALIALPYALEGLSSRVLFEDRFEFACYPGHTLAEQIMVSAAELADQSLMLLEDGHCLRGHALDACQLQSEHERSQYEASSLHTLVQMVAAGIGVTLLPKLAIDAGIAQGTGITLIPLENQSSRQIGLVWRQSSLRGKEVDLIGDALTALHSPVP